MLIFGIRLPWLGLNIIRVVSIATLAVVMASSIMVMIRDANAICREMGTSGVPKANESNQIPSVRRAYIPSSTVPLQPGGPFFAILSRLLVVCQCFLIILSELGWPRDLFIKFLPILGPENGVGIIGTMQVLLSALVLSHHIPLFALVPGLLLFATGCLNVILGLAFRNNIHVYRALATCGPNNNNQEPDTSDSLNRRISFRPGRERPAAQNSATDTTHTSSEKPPSYKSGSISKSEGYAHGEMSAYYDRISQQCAEKDREPISFPEQAHSKH
ncbi:unnamed protein product [Rhizoctonia solani]|uniref:DUF7598 domain-containing protein n=1 Tax=Rhizoctonia solani TaxID=456999 RepID=A0A8H2ZZV0_9AGAM|nr:unnamed protein product [Rhizoctonia solani]